MQFQAEPYPLEFDPGSTALLIIDMQRDFVSEPGGFGEMLGNDVSLLRSAIALPARPRGGARRGKACRCFTPTGGTARPRRRAVKLRRSGELAVGIGDRGPMGRVLVRGEYGRHHPRALSAARRAGDRQAGQGLVLRDRPRPDPPEPRDQDPDRVRRHDRGLRAYDGLRRTTRVTNTWCWPIASAP